MKLHISTWYIILLSGLLCGLSIFTYGFFPSSYSSPKKSGFFEMPKYIQDVELDRSLYKPRFSRTILMIIDAFRRDFIRDERYPMSYIRSLISRGESCIIDLKVHPPTVTMPRIKALTSGTIPNFIDLVLNLGSNEMKIDNFLSQLNNQNEGGIVFYGDDTWTKMFPNTFKRQGDNVDSLFVNDFYEGDRNITERLSAECVQPDWKMLILHYLGLDHIGHVEGPFSAKVPGKLEEMDKVFTKIVSSMSRWNKNSYLPALFLLTADHGMRDGGGHGGSTQNEILVPFIVTGPNCSSSQVIYNQIDVSTTLSILLGLPIPYSSIGVIIPELLADFTPAETLYAFHYNNDRLLDKVRRQFQFDRIEDQEFFKQHTKAITSHGMFYNSGQKDNFQYKLSKLSYESSAKEMSSLLSQNFLKYDLWAIGSGVFICSWAILVLVLMSTLDFTAELYLKHNLRQSLVTLISGILLKHALCKLFPIDSDLFCFSFSLNIMFIAIIFILRICFDLTLKLVSLLRDKFRPMAKIRNPFSFPGFVVLVTLTSLLILTASSFIEEEHLFWYYFCSTLIVYLFVKDIKSHLWHDEEFILLKLFHKTQRKINQNDSLYRKMEYCHDAIVSFIILILGHMIARRFNQTGDKWSHLRDIGDFLVEDGQKLYLSFLVFCALGSTLYISSEFNGFLTNVLNFTASILIYFFRSSTNQVSIFSIQLFTSSSKMPILLFWLNIFEIALIEFFPLFYRAFFLNRYQVTDGKQGLGALINILTMISCMLHKPHNIIMVPLLIFTCNWVNGKLTNIECLKPQRALLVMVTYFWIGKLFYFYQGNSNSLATIDLTAGYIGQSHYNPVLVGIFLTLNTFSGPILTTLLAIYHVYGMAAAEDSAKDLNEKTLTAVLKAMSFLIGLPIYIYLFVLTSFRNHLFIWSVFSPKLIYELYFFTLFYIILFVYYILSKLSQRLKYL